MSVMPPHAPATHWIAQYRWRSLNVPGFELLELGARKSGVEARGMIVSEAGGRGYGATYHIRLGQDWTFQALNLQLLDGRRLVLRSDGQGRWTENEGTPRPDLADCIDIDLSGSPFTNTLPIRRTALAMGEPQAFTMAYVDLSALEVCPHEQDYTKLGDTRYRYRSATSGYEAELTVDTDGFVVSYPNLFQRIED